MTKNIKNIVGSIIIMVGIFIFINNLVIGTIFIGLGLIILMKEK